MNKFKLRYLIPFLGTYYMWQELRDISGEKSSPSFGKTADLRTRLLYLTPVFGNLLLLRQIEQLLRQIEQLKASGDDLRGMLDVSLQIYDVKIDRIYKAAIDLLEANEARG